MRRLLFLFFVLFSVAPSWAQQVPYPGVTVTAQSTISVTNTFQVALAAKSDRISCLIQNQGTHLMYVFFGGTATTAKSFQVNPGNSISCANVNGSVITDQVMITGTATDSYVVTSQ